MLAVTVIQADARKSLPGRDQQTYKLYVNCSFQQVAPSEQYDHLTQSTPDKCMLFYSCGEAVHIVVALDVTSELKFRIT